MHDKIVFGKKIITDSHEIKNMFFISVDKGKFPNAVQLCVICEEAPRRPLSFSSYLTASS